MKTEQQTVTLEQTTTVNPEELSDEALDELISESVTVQAWGWWPHHH